MGARILLRRLRRRRRKLQLSQRIQNRHYFGGSKTNLVDYLTLRRLDTLGSRSFSLSQKIIDKLAWREDMAISRKKAEQKQNNKKNYLRFLIIILRRTNNPSNWVL